MGAEYLLYGYGLVCLSMLVFNLVYSLYLRGGDRRLTCRTDLISRRVSAQLELLRQAPAGTSQPVQASHLAWMNRRLSRVKYLLAFDRCLDEQGEADLVFRDYLRQLQPVALYLATVYLRREATQAAYYCHFLARHKLQRYMEMEQLQQVMISYLRRKDLYCRINALKALCGFGSPDALLEALLELGKDADSQLHEKVITEALLTYAGDAGVLIGRLWDCFDRFPLQIQRAVLDYIRFRSGECGAPMEKILRDPGRNKELRFAAIRYFARYPDPAVQEILLEFVQDRDPLRWEYAAISATALARYPGQEVVDALLQAMHSPNWYVRYNASASLEAHGLSYEQMLQVLAGDDRYAREMLYYRLEAKRLEEQARAAGEGAGRPEGEEVAVPV